MENTPGTRSAPSTWSSGISALILPPLRFALASASTSAPSWPSAARTLAPGTVPLRVKSTTALVASALVWTCAA